MSAKPFFESNGLQIHRDDFLTTGRIAAGTMDLIVTSPPYNVDWTNGVWTFAGEKS